MQELVVVILNAWYSWIIIKRKSKDYHLFCIPEWIFDKFLYLLTSTLIKQMINQFLVMLPVNSIVSYCRIWSVDFIFILKFLWLFSIELTWKCLITRIKKNRKNYVITRYCYPLCSSSTCKFSFLCRNFIFIVQDKPPLFFVRIASPLTFFRPEL